MVFSKVGPNQSIEWGQFRVSKSVTPETLFQTSSIGMPVTAVAVPRLVEQGKLNLDADVSQYLRAGSYPPISLRNRRR
jgi:CubicO group peptidase (beta-lactamase class C family)